MSEGVQSALRVLLVEDNPGDADLVLEGADDDPSRPLDITVRTTLGAALTEVERHPPDVILLDLGLPDSSGLGTFVRMQEATPNTPIIALTGQQDVTVAARCLELGAQDYLVKGRVERFIGWAVHNTLARARVQRALLESRENLKGMVTDSPDAIVVLDAEHTVRFANRAAAHLLGEEATFGRKSSLPPARAGVREIEVPRFDGSIAKVEVRDSDSVWYGEPARVVMLRDITDRMEAKAKLEHINRVLRAIRNINKLIVREKDVEQLIQQACDMLVNTRGYGGAWIAVREVSGRATAIAQAGWGVEFAPFARRLESGQWPSSLLETVTRTAGVVALDVATAGADWPPPARAGSGKALVATMRRQDMMLGALGVAVPPGMVIDDEEKSLLEEVAGDIAFALHDIALDARMRESEAENRALWDQAPVQLMLVDKSRRVRKANQMAMATLGGADVNDLHIGEVLRCVHWHHGSHQCGVGSACTDCSLQRALAQTLDLGRAVQRAEAIVPVFTEGNGAKVTRLLLSSAPLAVQGERLALVCSLDVTELREAEEGRLAALRKAQQYLDIVGSIIVALDHEGVVTLINQKGCEVLALPEHEIVGKRWFDDFVVARARDTVLPLAEDLLAGRRNEAIHETAIVTSRGEERLVAWKCAVVKDSAGEVVGILNSGEDITEQRRAQEHLNQAQRLEAIGTLAGGVAHDFNNLLTVILSHAEFSIQTLRTGDPVRDDILAIHEAGTSAAALTRQLLAFSRKQILQPKVIEIGAAILGIEKMLRRLLGEHIEITVVLANDVGRVEADPSQIEQVLVNLAVNARDAMPDGGRLTIEAKNVELDDAYEQAHAQVRPGPFVMLSVSDTGRGMDAKTRQRIFEPFFTTRQAEGGTGLGLATVYGIVNQSGGYVWVYSEPGNGTTFKVYLPRVEAPATVSMPHPPPASARGGETVLVVEDEDALRRVAERVLARAGFRVLTAANGGEALLICESHGERIDLLLTDVVMPKMSGRELHERAVLIRPGLKVLYMSGYTDNSIAHHGVLDQGMQFIAKPFSIPDLTQKVRDVLDEAG